MTLRELLNRGEAALAAAEKEDACFDARELLLHAAGMSRTDYILHASDPAAPAAERQYNKWIARRAAGEPLQYLLGEWEFYGLTLSVGEGVLIPRPETEQICDIALQRMKPLQEKLGRPLEVLDLCAGTGCIGLAISSFFPACHVTFLEKSPQAFHYLRENILRTNQKDCTAVRGDLMNGFASFSFPRPDVLVSNPPYVANSEMESLSNEVRSEPEMALRGGSDGLDFYRAIADDWLPAVNPGGLCLAECGDGQSEAVSRLLAVHASNTKVWNDFNGIGRIIQADL